MFIFLYIIICLGNLYSVPPIIRGNLYTIQNGVNTLTMCVGLPVMTSVQRYTSSRKEFHH